MIKIKVSYSDQEELQALLELLGDAVYSCSKPYLSGGYYRVYILAKIPGYGK